MMPLEDVVENEHVDQPAEAEAEHARREERPARHGRVTAPSAGLSVAHNTSMYAWNTEMRTV